MHASQVCFFHPTSLFVPSIILYVDFITGALLVLILQDMVLLPDIKDAGIVANLKNRLRSEQIYTYIGNGNIGAISIYFPR